jgi:hypothetical protein
MNRNDIIKSLGSIIRPDMKIRPVVKSTNVKYSAYGANTFPMNLDVIEEYVSMRSSVDALITKRMATPLVNSSGCRISYDVSIGQATMCVIMMACPNYVVSTKTIPSVDSMFFSQFWRALYLASLNDTKEGKWIKDKMNDRERRVFCVINNIPIVNPDKAERFTLHPHPDLLSRMSSTVEVLKDCSDCHGRLSAGSCNYSYAKVLGALEYTAAKAYRDAQ